MTLNPLQYKTYICTHLNKSSHLATCLINLCSCCVKGLKLLQKAKKDKALEIKVSGGREGGRPVNMRRIFRGKLRSDLEEEEGEENDDLAELEHKIK